MPVPQAADQAADDGGPAWHLRGGGSLWVLLIAPVALAGLGVWGLGRGGAYDYDEGASRWAALLPFRDLFRLLRHSDAVHGLYYIGLHAWIVFGDGPIALRLPSLLASIAAAGVVTALGRSLGRSTAEGLVAGLLYAFSPFVMFFAQTARSFAIVSLVVASATLVLVRALDAERDGAGRSVVVRRWIGYTALVALAGWLNELSLLVLAAHAITMAVGRFPRRTFAHWLSAAVAALAAVSPLLAISMRQMSAVAAGRATLHRMWVLLGDIFGPDRPVMLVAIGCTVAALLPHKRAQPTRLVSVALPILVVPPLILAGEAAIGRPLFHPRYLLYTSIGAVLLVSHGALRIGRRLWANRPRAAVWVPVFGVGVALFTLLAQIPVAEHIRAPDSRINDFGSPAALVAAQARPGDGVLFFDSLFRMVELTYPQDFRNVRDIALGESPPASGTFLGIDVPYPTARARILSYDRIWAIGLPPNLRHLGPVSLDELGLLRRHFSRVATHVFTGVDVTLWLRRQNSDSRRASVRSRRPRSPGGVLLPAGPSTERVA